MLRTHNVITLHLKINFHPLNFSTINKNAPSRQKSIWGPYFRRQLALLFEDFSTLHQTRRSFQQKVVNARRVGSDVEALARVGVAGEVPCVVSVNTNDGEATSSNGGKCGPLDFPRIG